MAHGAIDYSNVWKEGSVYRLDDLAELAVRLGSIVSFDRRGDVLWFDDFSNGFASFSNTGSDIGDNTTLSTYFVLNAPYSVKQSVTNLVTDTALLQKRLILPQTNKIGFSLSCSVFGVVDTYYMVLTVDTGNVYYDNYVWIDFTNHKVYVRDENAVYQLILTSPLLQNGTSLFYNFKIVIDITNGTYDRFILDNIETDISSISLRSVATQNRREIFPRSYLVGNNNFSGTIYLDHMIITINE